MINLVVFFWSLQSRIRLLSIFGAGLLVGTALCVIIPEGVESLYGAQAGSFLPSSFIRRQLLLYGLMVPYCWEGALQSLFIYFQIISFSFNFFSLSFSFLCNTFPKSFIIQYKREVKIHAIHSFFRQLFDWYYKISFTLCKWWRMTDMAENSIPP